MMLVEHRAHGSETFRVFMEENLTLVFNKLKWIN
jgi:hypothetical protein